MNDFKKALEDAEKRLKDAQDYLDPEVPGALQTQVELDNMIALIHGFIRDEAERRSPYQELNEVLELLRIYGNEKDIRSEEFAIFVREAYAKKPVLKNFDRFVRQCIDIFRGTKS